MRILYLRVRVADTSLQDASSYNSIMTATDPAVIKKLGRGVKGFDDPQWQCVAFDVVVRANILKFTQVESMHRIGIYRLVVVLYNNYLGLVHLRLQYILK